MMRQLVSFFVSLCIAFAPQAALAVNKSPGGAPGLTNAASVSITGGTITGVSGVSYKLAHTAIPLIAAPTGTMANNGAMTMGTALATTYAQGYFLVPAGAIAAGVPAAADWYYGTASSTTLVTLFNNTLSANVDANGMPTIPASPTAFATTGPGAFTGVTAATTALTLTVPAGAMGANGIYEIDLQVAMTGGAANKTCVITFGGTTIFTNAVNAVAAGRINAWVKNRNSASVQTAFAQGIYTSTSLAGAGGVYASINTASAVSVVVQVTRPTATDTWTLEEATEIVTNQS